MNILIMTVGLPRAGKSTWCKEYSKKHGIPIVEPDAVRLSLYNQPFITEMEELVWHYVKIMIKSLFTAGHDKVILDNTGVTENLRMKWLSPDWDIKFKVFDTPADVCIQRAIDGEREDLILVIERMDAAFESLNEWEKEKMLEEE